MAKKSNGRSQGCAQGQRGAGGGGGLLDTLRVNTDENTLKWIFHRAPDAQWRWRKTSEAEGLIAESKVCYPDYDTCVADAEAHGYKKWLIAGQLTALSFAHGIREPSASNAAAPNSAAVALLKLIPLRGNGAR